MKVRMLTSISGTRDGEDWPKAGGTIDVSDAEGADLIAAGLAADAGAGTVETATAPPAEENAAATPRKRARKSPAKKKASK